MYLQIIITKTLLWRHNRLTGADNFAFVIEDK